MRESRVYRLIAASYVAFVACGLMGKLWCLALLPVLTGLFYWGMCRFAPKSGEMFCLRLGPCASRSSALKSAFVLFVAVMAVLVLDRTVSLGWGFRMDDAFGCWNECLSGRYTNWHPALYTFLFFGVPHLVSENINAAILMHLLSLAVGIAAVGYSLLREGVSRRWVTGVVLLMVCNPFTLLQALKAVKDVAFAASFLVSLACVARVILSRGRWFEQKWHVMATGFAMAVTLVLRHNAMFVVLPLAFMLLWSYGSRMRIMWFLSVFLVTLGCIYGPLYHNALHVAKESDEFRHRHLLWESCGLPISTMGAVYQAHAEQIPAENRAWMESILPPEMWRKNYFHCFNSVKFGGHLISSATPSWRQFWDDFSACAKIDPELVWRTFLVVTSQVWNPLGSVDLSHAEELSARLRSFPGPIRKIGEQILYVHFNCIIGIVTGCLVIWLGVAPNRKTALVVLPVMAYNLGTMILLSGNDARFFFYCIVAFPLMVTLLMPVPDECVCRG